MRYLVLLCCWDFVGWYFLWYHCFILIFFLSQASQACNIKLLICFRFCGFFQIPICNYCKIFIWSYTSCKRVLICTSVFRLFLSLKMELPSTVTMLRECKMRAVFFLNWNVITRTFLSSGLKLSKTLMWVGHFYGP